MENEFNGDYYDESYFVTPNGKSCVLPDGSIKAWSYRNPTGDWGGAAAIIKSWIDSYHPINMLDIGAGRGTFIGYAREAGINAIGFDFSSFAVSDKGRFAKCPKECLIQHDATQRWPYANGQFDFTVCLDLMEHVYEDDIDFVINELYRVSNKHIFLQIAVSPYADYSLKKGEPVPEKWKVMTLTGHVLVKNREWWLKRLERAGWRYNQELVDKFYANMNPKIAPESAWAKNLIAVLEKI